MLRRRSIQAAASSPRGLPFPPAFTALIHRYKWTEASRFLGVPSAKPFNLTANGVTAATLLGCSTPSTPLVGLRDRPPAPYLLLPQMLSTWTSRPPAASALPLKSNPAGEASTGTAKGEAVSPETCSSLAHRPSHAIHPRCQPISAPFANCQPFASKLPSFASARRMGTTATPNSRPKPKPPIPHSNEVARQIGERARSRQQSRLWTLAVGGVAVAGFVIAGLNTFQENLMFYITPTQALEKFRSDSSRNRFRLGGLVLEGSVRKFVNTTEMEFVITDLETDILVRYRGALPDLFREGHSIVAEGFLQPMPSTDSAAETRHSVSLATTRPSQGAPQAYPFKAPAGIQGYVQPSSGAQAKALPAADLNGSTGTAPTVPTQLRLVTSGEQNGGRDGEEFGGGIEDAAKKARGLEVQFTALEVLAKHDEKYMPKEVAAAIAVNRAKQELEQDAAAAGTARGGEEGVGEALGGVDTGGVVLPQPLAMRKESQELGVGRKGKAKAVQTPSKVQAYDASPIPDATATS